MVGCEDRARRIDKTIALFEKKRPKIEVKTDFRPYLDLWKKCNTQASGGNPPDVFRNAIGLLRNTTRRTCRWISVSGSTPATSGWSDPRR